MMMDQLRVHIIDIIIVRLLDYLLFLLTREYAVRRTRDAFKEHKNEQDPKKIASLLKSAEENLDIVRRQVLIGEMYGDGRLIIESTIKHAT